MHLATIAIFRFRTMRIKRSIGINEETREVSPTVLTIGNFDGVHLGHCAMLERLLTTAKVRNLPAILMTFEPHPREFFSQHTAPGRLTTFREKMALIAKFPIARAYVLRFNAQLAAVSAANFIEHYLVNWLRASHIIIGDDFRFGHKRSGDFHLLQKKSTDYGYSCEALHSIKIDNERVSSSAVRNALASGNLLHATRLLGRTYSISGRVVSGLKLGRELGFPTANIRITRTQLALDGIFAVQVSGIGTKLICAAASLGVRPTIGDNLVPVLEVHLLDYDGNTADALYGALLTVHFLHKIRSEIKFLSLADLRAQIADDIAKVRAYFASTSETDTPVAVSRHASLNTLANGMQHG